MKVTFTQNRLAAALAVVVVVVGVSVLAGPTHNPTGQTALVHIVAPHLLANAGSASSSTQEIGTTTLRKSVATTTPTTSTTVQPIEQPVSATTQQARDLNVSGSQLLKSVVNIVCISGDSSVPSVSASGVIIDSRGIILTAAHVAQLFLLQDYLGSSKIECLIRTGSPARRAYTAEPIYVSKSWIDKNPTTLTSSDPIGTGQNDVALLGITGTATSTPLPASYPFISLASGNPQVGDQVAIGSYGAQYLTGDEINYSLYPILTFGSIKDRYTYGNNTEDLISVTGGAASQEGSSGGGVSNAQGQLIGVVTTSSIIGSFNTRSLNAITPLHLRATYLQDTGHDLTTDLQSESVQALIAGFATESKTLGAQLLNNITVNGK